MGIRRPLLALVAVAALFACRSDSEPNVLVTANLGADELRGHLFVLRVLVQGGGKEASRDYRLGQGAALAFPTSFTLSVDKGFGGLVDVGVKGLDALGNEIAQGDLTSLRLSAGHTLRQDVLLNCIGNCPAGADAGTGPDVAPPPPDTANCGNGRLDPGETCDMAIAAGLPGACPKEPCNDAIACTSDVKIGSGCTAQCAHAEIVSLLPGDGCCPANGIHETDEDCSSTCGNGTVDPSEYCDKAISAGLPGACPSAAVCNDGNVCTLDRLISANTCAARCTHQGIVAVGLADLCCPANATAGSDADCPVVCGDGVVEAGETCDVGIGAGKSGACPRNCDDDKSCTNDVFSGAGCQVRCVHTEVAPAHKSDACCPAGTSALADPDCANTCGNGVIEPGESCDKGIVADQTGACPKACAPLGCNTLLLKGSPESCSVVCEVVGVAGCVLGASDGCCSPGCTPLTDPDCLASCGNGQLDEGESCDKAITAPAAGAFPAACDDGDPCTEDYWDSKGSCLDRCVHRPLAAFKSGDLCCPAGANRSVDADCASVCGNGVIELGEECDLGIAVGKPGACPTACVPTSACTAFTLLGTAALCAARCEANPVIECVAQDGCCPAGCNHSQDADCPTLCGNGRVEPGEACDKGITAGFPGACASSCEDAESCSQSIATGSVENCTRLCAVFRIRACAPGDGCCPVGCSFRTDPDCAPICGNGTVEDGETCDPPASCPTACQADGDVCTAAKLLGDPVRCTSRCTQVPVLECGPMADQCCPTGCSSSTADPDCKAPVKSADLTL